LACAAAPVGSARTSAATAAAQTDFVVCIGSSPPEGYGFLPEMETFYYAARARNVWAHVMSTEDTMSRKRPEDLRSHRWLGVSDMRSFGHRSRLRQIGYDAEDWTGKPVIGIINTWSEINPCHAHLRSRAENVKRGVLQAGGFPIELPALSLSETFVKPSTMMYRNMLAMETEELLRSHPLDGAVLMGGCDKTTPGLVMGAVSMGIPAIYIPAGPMLRGNWNGQYLGSGSDVWKYWTEKRAGNISEAQWDEIENGIARSFGTCMVMGTAATMMAITEALGLALPGASSIPAADSNHPRMCGQAGRRIVEMVWEDLTPDKILTPAAFDNAIKVHMAMGGSTNAIIHVVAMARRAGIPVDMEKFDQLSRQIPVLANVRPSGKYLMEDFFYAGGLRALMQNLRQKLDLSCITVTGKTIGENIEGAKVHLPDVIHGLNDPIYAEGATAVLKGNLAPNGCVIKPAAADPRFLKHRGKAIAFEDYNHMMREVERDDLDVTPDHILVLKNAGPQGGPGMPEWGMLPIPKRLLGQGVRDMIRISDGRMSGTSYGACILHVAPESFVGGPLNFVQTGDEIEIDVDKRSIHLHVSGEELARRKAAWKRPTPKYPRGYGAMFSEHIGQADQGCDFDFLQGKSVMPEPEIH
jgi:dihydroxy-acid dehydratase